MPGQRVWNRLNLFLVLACSFFAIAVGAASGPSERETVVIVVRHAEKSDAPSDDPPLNDVGRKRAEALAYTVSKAGAKAIFATQYQRTQQTVEPTAQALRILVTKIEAAKTDMLVGEILDKHRGEVVLVAGHSNTIPAIIESLGGEKITPMSETEFDNLFVVTAPTSGPARVLHLRYGAPD